MLIVFPVTCSFLLQLPAPKPGPQPGSPACLLKARLVAVEAEKEALEAEKAAYLLTNSRLACQMADKTIKWVKADDAIRYQ